MASSSLERQGALHGWGPLRDDTSGVAQPASVSSPCWGDCVGEVEVASVQR